MMSEQPFLVSIIIPVYNAAPYLETCLQSVLSQSYTCIEIILIDDGSTDHSGILCDAYAEKDDRMVVVHKENKGVSSARNRGVTIAKGDFLTFIDADDWVEDTYIENLLQPMIQDENIDMTITDFYVGKETLRKNSLIAGRMDKNVFLYEMINGMTIPPAVWGKLYRRHVLGETPFDEDFLHGEDLLAIWNMRQRTRIIVYVSHAGYHYVPRLENQSSHTIQLLLNPKFRNDLFLAYDTIYNDLEDQEESPLRSTIEWNFLEVARSVVQMMGIYQRGKELPFWKDYPVMQNAIDQIMHQRLEPDLYAHVSKLITSKETHICRGYDALIEYLRGCRKIYIYGAGQVARLTAEFLCYIEVKFCAFVIGDTQVKDTQASYSCPVLYLRELSDIERATSDLLIGMNLKNTQSVWRELTHYGFRSVQTW